MTDTLGGSVTFHRFGILALRGHTFSVPHNPMGITGAPLICARRAAPHRPFSTGSKKARPRGIVPCGIIATISPASSAASASLRGSSLPGPPLDADAAHGPGHVADDGGVEHLLLPQEAHGPTPLGDGEADRGDVEVAAMVGAQDRRALGRDVVHALDGDVHIREPGPGARTGTSTSAARSHQAWARPGGTSRKIVGQRRARACRRMRGSGLTTKGWPTALSRGTS